MEFVYPVIDTAATAGKIRSECTKRGYSARFVQEAFGIGSIQSVYNWFRGVRTPSLDNMLALSCLLEMPMEELIVCRNDSAAVWMAAGTNGRKGSLFYGKE